MAEFYFSPSDGAQSQAVVPAPRSGDAPRQHILITTTTREKAAAFFI